MKSFSIIHGVLIYMAILIIYVIVLDAALAPIFMWATFITGFHTNRRDQKNKDNK